jgi:hypothetical protein
VNASVRCHSLFLSTIASCSQASYGLVHRGWHDHRH